MHELSIADTIISTVIKEMNSKGYTTVSEIGLRIGEMTDINEDSLRFGLEALTKDTTLDGVKISIELVPLQGRCKACEKEFRIIEFSFVCPECEAVEIEVILGKELDITYLNVETTTEKKM